MAEYHLTIKIISRADGRNAVKSAAYRHGQDFSCNSTGEVFRYGKKKDVEHSEISVPEAAPAWAEALTEMDPHEASQRLWNAVESLEKRKDAQLAREVEFSLPHELTKDQRLALAREFIRENFTAYGMIADWSMHNHFDEKDGIEKPHVHVMLTTRVLQEACEDRHWFGPKERSWNQKSWLLQIRQNWELCANKHLQKAGLDVWIDHRSYQDRGIEFAAQPKLGQGSHARRNQGQIVERWQEMARVKAQNKVLILHKPEVVLDYLTRQQSVFTRRDIARILNRYVDDPDEFARAMQAVEASRQLVRIADDQLGKDPKFTTQAMIQLELSLIKTAKILSHQNGFAVLPDRQAVWIERMNQQLKQQGKGVLSPDQVHALAHLCAAERLKVVIGYAGTGKSTSLTVARQIWQEAGYRVVGAAPTGKAAEALEGTGIAAKTLHKWEHEWQRERELLGTKDILVVDEAGMIDARRLQDLLQQSEQRGFKVVLVGDPEQLSPIEAGCGLRTVMAQVGFVTLSTVQRQQEAWQRQATVLLATRQTEEALKMYQQQKYLYWGEQAQDKLLADYRTHMQTRLREEPLNGVILAHTNQHVQQLNQRARAVARVCGRLQGPDHLLTVARPKQEESLEQFLEPRADRLLKMVKEDKPFAVGEQIVFLRNDDSLKVRNGQFGVIQKIDEGFLQVEMASLKTITFDLSQYRFFDHGYATTIHKSQASTVEQTFLYASQGMDRHLTYVGLTRHCHQAHIYADKAEFSSLKQLYSCLSRENLKENVFDYALEKQLVPSSLLEAGTPPNRKPELPLIETFLAIREQLQAYPNPLHRTTQQRQEIEVLLEHSRQVSYHIKQDPDLMRRIQELGFAQNVKTQASTYKDSPHAYSQNKSYTKGRGVKI